MAVVVFKWGEKQLTLFQNRENWESCMVERVNWDQNDEGILGGRYPGNGGTWCGISKQGRVAFLVDTMPFNDVSRCELIPVAFLKGALSPQEFGDSVAAEDVMYNGLAFNLVVADTRSESMLYIAKRNAREAHVEIRNVNPGIHILSLAGLDPEPAPHQHERLRQEFGEMISAGNEDIQEPQLKEFALSVMTDKGGYNPCFSDLRNAITHRIILSGRCEDNNGTWFAISKRGRVAFLVNTAILLDRVDNDSGSEMYPIEFLQSNMSPQEFANHVAKREEERHEEELDDEDYGLSYSLIVADMTSNSMVHIRKPEQDEPNVISETVPFGVHTLSSYEGLDSTESPRESRLRGFFSQMIVDLLNVQLPPLMEIAGNTEGGRNAVFLEFMDEHPSEELGMQRYGTTSTTALAVKRTREVILFERYREENGGWNEHDFNFNIQ